MQIIQLDYIYIDRYIREESVGNNNLSFVLQSCQKKKKKLFIR